MASPTYRRVRLGTALTDGRAHAMRSIRVSAFTLAAAVVLLWWHAAQPSGEVASVASSATLGVAAVAARAGPAAAKPRSSAEPTPAVLRTGDADVHFVALQAAPATLRTVPASVFEVAQQPAGLTGNPAGLVVRANDERDGSHTRAAPAKEAGRLNGGVTARPTSTGNRSSHAAPIIMLRPGTPGDKHSKAPASGKRRRPERTREEVAFAQALSRVPTYVSDGPFSDPSAFVGAAPRGADSIGGFPFLMLLGTSKGGSTFLFSCMERAFHPRVVCGNDDAEAWSADRCGPKRFLLAGLRLALVLKKGKTGGVEVPRGPLALRLNVIKENYVLTRGMYRGPMVEPERTRFYRGPSLPLEMWEARNMRTHTDPVTVKSWLNRTLQRCAASIPQTGKKRENECPLREFRGLGAPYAFRGMAGAREGEACGFKRSVARTQPRGARVQPGDDDGEDLASPMDSVEYSLASAGDRLCAHASHANRTNRLFSDARAFAPSLNDTPFERPWESRLLSFDGCPYNLGSSQAPSVLRHMHASAAIARQMRFVVLVRDPVDRAYSEWAMTSRWRGAMHKAGNFGAHARSQAKTLQACCGGRLGALVRGEVADQEFYTLYDRCIDADYYAYVKNSMYGLHLRSWLRYFPPESFLLLQTEKMAQTQPADLLGQIARFAGLHFDPASLQDGPFAVEVRTNTILMLCDNRNIILILLKS
mmetsp:Transcript_15203/g.35367  ORF Transcript_15203/g.35367 Transcript_15203/m.35367 type:complete len:704 (-) Transcript_15203:239-2350(-)